MAFDTRSYLDALTPPSMTHNGVTFTGTFLSVDETLVLIDKMQATRGQDARVVERVLGEIIDAIFPPPTVRVRRFWAPWGAVERDRSRPSCRDVLETLPLGVRQEAVADFFSCLADALTPASAKKALLAMTPERRAEALEARLALAHATETLTATTTTPPSTSAPTDVASAPASRGTTSSPDSSDSTAPTATATPATPPATT